MGRIGANVGKPGPKALLPVRFREDEVREPVVDMEAVEEALDEAGRVGLSGCEGGKRGGALLPGADGVGQALTLAAEAGWALRNDEGEEEVVAVEVELARVEMEVLDGDRTAPW